MKKLKIAHVSSEYWPAIGGVGQVVMELAKRQAKAGHEVHVYAPDWDKYKRIKKRYEKVDGVHIHRIFHVARVANFATLYPGVFGALRKGKYDVIHSHVFGHLHFVLSEWAAALTGAKHVHTTHCPWSDAKRSLVGRIGLWLSYNTLSRWALHGTDKIISITPWEHDFIQKYGGRKERIINLPNGMSDIFFKKITKNDFKEKLGIKGKMVLFFGRLNPTKGPDKFVEFAKLVLRERPETRFVMVGPDEGMEEIVRKKIGEEKRIMLLGPIRDRKEVAKMYQAADVFVLPSYREGLPLTLFEAMACGAPLVASPCNGVPYEMKEPDNGFLVKYGQNKKYAQRIMEFLDSKKLRDKIRANNLKTSKRYRWDDIFKKTMKVYGDLLE